MRGDCTCGAWNCGAEAAPCGASIGACCIHGGGCDGCADASLLTGADGGAEYEPT